MPGSTPLTPCPSEEARPTAPGSPRVNVLRRNDSSRSRGPPTEGHSFADEAVPEERESQGRASRETEQSMRALIALEEKLGEKQKNTPHIRFPGDYDDQPPTTRQPQERTSSMTIIDNSPLVSSPSEDAIPAAEHETQTVERPSSAALRISEYFSTSPQSPRAIPSKRPHYLPDL